MLLTDAEQLVLECNGLRFAAQRWKNHTDVNKDKKLHPVLCLHGWLDNSESFAQLAARMPGCDVVAVDMAGHGHTEHRSVHASYNIWDDFEDINGIADALGWAKYSLMGHSRGAIISFLFCAVMPDRISQLVLLDGIYGLKLKKLSVVEQMRAYLIDRQKLGKQMKRVYRSIETALDKRLLFTQLSADEARALVERNLKPVDGGYSWRYDTRLQGTSAMGLTAEQLEVYLQALDKPTLLLLAKEGLFADYDIPAEILKKPNLDISWHDGKHHMHMQTQWVDSLAAMITTWLSNKDY